MLKVKRCIKCGEEKPATPEFFNQRRASRDGLQSKCRDCQANLFRAWREKNRERLAERGRNYRKENREVLAEKKRRYYKDNIGKMRKKSALYREANREGVLRANRRKGFTERGWSIELRLATYKSQGGQCAVCKKPCPESVPPGYRGKVICGDHDHANGQPRALLCLKCNSALGMAGDDPDRLLSLALYVTGWRARHAGATPEQIEACRVGAADLIAHFKTWLAESVPDEQPPIPDAA